MKTLKELSPIELLDKQYDLYADMLRAKRMTWEELEEVEQEILLRLEFVESFRNK